MIAALEKEYDHTMNEIERLDDEKKTCEKRLENADKLINLLSSEGERWKITVELLVKEKERLNGNVFVAASSISYIGPFTVNIYDLINSGILQRKASLILERTSLREQHSD